MSQHFAASGFRHFDQYLSADKKIIIHAGGQSRRLPAYAPLGKILTPIPVFRWSRGQRLDQTLLDLQLPLYERLMEMTAPDVNTLIASGDVLIRYSKLPAELPSADIICLGIWVDPHLASRHGVFFTPGNNPSQLDFMLQKPTHSQIENLATSYLFMMDVGVWVLSDKAISVVMENCGWNKEAFRNSRPDFYDLYSTFGTCMGIHPENQNPKIQELSVAIVPLEGGDFYHYGTSEELISSTVKIQNTVKDRRAILHNRVKPHPSLFVQNAITNVEWTSRHHHIWVENSVIPASWELSAHHIITGIPENDWRIDLPPGICVDVVPVGETRVCLRPYHMKDKFSGTTGDEDTTWLGMPLVNWLKQKGLHYSDANFSENEDIQEVALFPVLETEQLTERLLKWMLGMEVSGSEEMCQWWLKACRLSASGISAECNIKRLMHQRSRFRQKNLLALSKNYKHSVFYQVDLSQVALDFVKGNLGMPDELPETESPYKKFRNYMLRSEILRNKGMDGTEESTKAFSVLQRSIVDSVPTNEMPRLNVFPDQIVWGRSPARLDLAGGWSDTPPFCLQNGGSVLNLAVDLNGQPPLQVFVRLSDSPHIVLRSIDNGVSEKIDSFRDLDFRNVGSAFSIPRAALCLAGFHPDFSGVQFASLKDQLNDFGGGVEISLLAAIPKGSGLGTSSILAATILGALADFCDLAWDKQAIAHRTLVLEQMLTTGGGWQDQYGGILPGIKLLETEPGTQEQMGVRWLPDLLFSQSPFKQNWLLYYTGITRVAKNILGEIVRGMFLNQGSRLRILDTIKEHAYETFDAIQQCDYEKTARMIKRSWELNKSLDPGTTTDAINSIINLIEPHTLGYKLLGAGGGGYLLICARDEEASARIRELLMKNPPNAKARFVDMDLNNKGLEISRS